MEKRRKIPTDLLLGFVLIIVLTIPFYIWRLDIVWSGCLFDASLPHPWLLRSAYPWNLFYKFGSWPAMMVAIFALLVVISGYFIRYCFPLRKPALYLVAVMLIGPGIVINVILKDHFGRPRPRHVEEFDGNVKYYQVWQPAFQEKGKSFPCGHCSMAFYFFSFYFLFKRCNRFLSVGGLMVGLLYGILMGIARVGQGGHFPSDVLWSGGLVYLTSGILYYYVFHLDQYEIFSIPDEGRALSGKQKMLVLTGGIAFIGILLAGILVYLTPFDLKINKQYSNNYRNVQFKAGQLDYRLSGTLTDSLKVELETNGFGVPGNRSRLMEEIRQDTLWLKHKLSGIHSEAKNFAVLSVPSSMKSLKMNCRNSNLIIDSTLTLPQLRVNLSKGSVKIFLSKHLRNDIQWDINFNYNKLFLSGLDSINGTLLLSGEDIKQMINGRWEIVNNPINFTQTSVLISGKQLSILKTSK